MLSQTQTLVGASPLTWGLFRLKSKEL